MAAKRALSSTIAAGLTLDRVGKLMRNNLWVKRKYTILSACVVGSVARGTDHDNSDIDIAVIIPKVRGKRAITVTEQYHARFSSDHQKPHFNGRQVDLQFFYENDPALKSYDTIPLK